MNKPNPITEIEQAKSLQEITQDEELAWKVATIIHHTPTGLNGKSYRGLSRVVAHILLDDVVGKALVAEFKMSKLKKDNL